MSKGKRKTSVVAMMAVLASLLLPVMVAAPAVATHVGPIFVDGNATCSQLTNNPNIKELKVDPPISGTYTSADGFLTVTVTTHDTAQGQTFDWTSNIGVDSVFAKGASQGNVYNYNPEATADTGLHTPINESGKYADLSHISFCYDLEADIRVTKNIPNVITGSESVTVTFVAVVNNGDPTVPADVKGTCSITFTVGETQDTCTITGLDPNTDYDIYETVTGNFDPQDPEDVKTGAGGSITGVTFTNTITPATATALKKTVPASASVENWEFSLYLDNAPAGAGGEDTLIDSDLTNAAGIAVFDEDLAEGNYYIVETAQAGFDGVANAGCSFTVDYPADNGRVFSGCEITNTQRGRIIVDKVTKPAGATQSFEFDPSYGANFFLADATTPNDSGLLVPGGYSVAELGPPAGWTLIDTTCVSSLGDTETAANLDLDPAETITCTFTNEQKGTIEVRKTVSGTTSNQTFVFELRQGAADTNPGTGDDTPGTLLNPPTGTIITANNQFVQLNGFLTPGTYQVCELLPTAGWESDLGGGPPPGGTQFVLTLGGDNSRVCTDVDVAVGEAEQITVDNSPPPGGQPLTIGFWKNHATCKTSNGSKPFRQLDDALIAAGGSILIGDAVVDTCSEAVNLLNKTPMNGSTKKKVANEPAFNLASQLLAARLNLAAGAGTCPDATAAINAGQALLDLVNFNGSDVPTMTTQQKADANTLAGLIDLYNNGVLCK
jgi:Prealbumin-like fold domain